MRKLLFLVILVSTIHLAATPAMALADCDRDLTAAGYFLEAQALADQGQNEQAIASYTCSIQRDPSYAGVYLSRARLFIALQDYERAIADYTIYLVLDPDNSEVYSLRGLAYGQLENGETAIADFNRAIELDPNNAPAYLNRSLEFYRQADDRCLDDVNRYLELRPEDWYAHHFRGVIYSVQRDYEQAIANYNRSIEFNPNYPPAYISRANAYAALEDYVQAAENYARAIELDPASA